MILLSMQQLSDKVPCRIYFVHLVTWCFLVDWIEQAGLQLSNSIKNLVLKAGLYVDVDRNA